jgi:hypothetical protein
VRAPGKNSFVKLYGWGIKDLSPLEYLELIKSHPKHIGPQVQWTEFPSTEKPSADLILRFEDIGEWMKKMVEAGLDIGERRMPHIGNSGNRGNLVADDVGLTEEEFRKLKNEIAVYYKPDFEAYGYTQNDNLR